MTLVMANGTTSLAEYLARAVPAEECGDDWTRGYEECKRRLHKVIGPQLLALDDAWISVDDRLPTPGEKVIVTFEMDCAGDWRQAMAFYEPNSRDRSIRVHNKGWRILGGSWAPTHWRRRLAPPLASAYNTQHKPRPLTAPQFDIDKVTDRPDRALTDDEVIAANKDAVLWFLEHQAAIASLVIDAVQAQKNAQPT